MTTCDSLIVPIVHFKWSKLGPRMKRLFGFVAGRTLKPKIPGPVVCVAPYNLKPNCTIAPSYPWVGFEISPRNTFWGGGEILGFLGVVVPKDRA